jgi:hypothetical protein
VVRVLAEPPRRKTVNLQVAPGKTVRDKLPLNSINIRGAELSLKLASGKASSEYQSLLVRA